MSFITAEGVSFSWGQARILQEVSLCAGKGKFVGVIGPNGSGKSTLVKIISGQMQKHASEMHLPGAAPGRRLHFSGWKGKYKNGL